MVVPEQVGDLDAVKLEETLMETWKEENTFQQQVDSRRSGKPFIFLEGPPTANGKPGIHHVVARTYKDLVCRWKAMEGFLVERKGGLGYPWVAGRDRGAETAQPDEQSRHRGIWYGGIQR